MVSRENIRLVKLLRDTRKFVVTEIPEIYKIPKDELLNREQGNSYTWL